MMRFDIYNPYSNTTVTDYYFSTIESALNIMQINTKRITALSEKDAHAADGIVVAALCDVIRAKKIGYSKVYVWVQGISPEESFIRNHSKIRRWLLSVREKKNLREADFVFLCSNAMKEHYHRKYKINLDDNSFIMPCFNDEIRKDAFYASGKYTDNIFIYAGALDPWQCFEETVSLYKHIEDALAGNCSLRVLTKDTKAAETIIEKYKVRNYSVGFVSHEKIGLEMEKAKFGFCLRADNEVNIVATPTKLSTYVSYGVLPIFTRYIEDFTGVASQNEYCVCTNFDMEKDTEKIVNICNRQISADNVYQSFDKTFGEYFSKDYYISRMYEEKIVPRTERIDGKQDR